MISATQNVPAELWRMVFIEGILSMPALTFDPVDYSRAPFSSLNRWHNEEPANLDYYVHNLRLVCRLWNHIASEFVGKALWISAFDLSDAQLEKSLQLVPKAWRIDFRAKEYRAQHIYDFVDDNEYVARMTKLRPIMMACLPMCNADALVAVSDEMIDVLSPEDSPPRSNVGALTFIGNAIRRISNAELSRRFPSLRYLNLQHYVFGDLGPETNDDDMDDDSESDEDESKEVMNFPDLRTLVISDDIEDLRALASAKIPSLTNLFLNGGPYRSQTILPGLTAVGQNLLLLSMTREEESIPSFSNDMWIALPRLLYLRSVYWSFLAAPPPPNHPLRHFQDLSTQTTGEVYVLQELLKVARAKPNLQAVAFQLNFEDVDWPESQMIRYPDPDDQPGISPEDEEINTVAEEFASMGIRFEDRDGRTLTEVRRIYPVMRIVHEIFDIRGKIKLHSRVEM